MAGRAVLKRTRHDLVRRRAFESETTCIVVKRKRRTFVMVGAARLMTFDWNFKPVAVRLEH